MPTLSDVSKETPCTPRRQPPDTELPPVMETPGRVPSATVTVTEERIARAQTLPGVLDFHETGHGP